MSEAAWRRRFRASQMSFPVWADDNPDRLVYLSNAGPKWEVYTWDRKLDAHRQFTDRPEGTYAVRIDPTGEFIWWFDDDKGNEFGRWMIDLFGSGDPRPAPVPPAYSAGLALGKSVSVVGSSSDQGSVIRKVRDGELERDLYAHREHAWVSGLSRDETLLCISHSEHGDSLHPALRVLDLEGNGLAELSDGPGLGLWASGWSRVPGDPRLLVMHERKDLTRPLIWNIETNEASEVDLDFPGEVDASWYPDASCLLVVHSYRGRDELFRLNLQDGSLEAIETPPGTIAAAEVRPDGEIWYAWTSSSTPPEIRTIKGVLVRPPGEAAPPGAAYWDGDAGGVHFFVAEPAGTRPHPTIFQIHGGPTSHDRDAFSPRVQAWVDHGFAVVLLNYRGSTGYGRGWRDAIVGSPGFTELEDIAKVFDKVASIGLNDPSRTVLAGGSWGGYLTLLGLGRQPERWSIGLASVPIGDYPAAYEDEMEPLKAYDRSLFGGSPEELPDLYRERSPINYVEDVAVPALILAGENDPRCPIRSIEMYIERLQGLNKPHEVYRFDAGHGSLVIEEVIRQVEKQIDFASRHLGTRPPIP